MEKEAMDLSSPRLISPLLDHFEIGQSISEHDGVRCYPALNTETGDRYMVKVISIPASALSLDAFLLSGVYSSKEEALAYYKDMASSTVHEAEALQYLSKLEGFTPYEGWQIVPNADNTGYEVYLLGTYKESLEDKIQSGRLTQLAAVNLGLDICAALNTARNSGCLCVDLRPTNIFHEGGKFKIGDLGYIPLSCLGYSSLPDRYRSPYTPPEIMDPMASISANSDVYALGMILYRVFNNGNLPDSLEQAPACADHEMAEIICKACSPDPNVRYADPQEMGQALVAYMQRNPVNDVAISAPSAEKAPEEAPEPVPVEQEAATEEPPEELPKQPAQEPEAAADPEPEEALYEELSLFDLLSEDENTPDDAHLGELNDVAIPDDTAEILAQLDDLVAHEAPAPVVVPDPIEVPMPESIAPEPPKEPEDETEHQPEDTTGETIAMPPLGEEAPNGMTEEHIGYAPEKKRSPWQSIAIAVCIIAALCIGAFYFYQNFYLQSVDSLEVNIEQTSAVITVRTSIPEDALTITCTDSYGNAYTSTVSGGTARFEGLTPDTRYNVSVSMSGFHKTVGATRAAFTTWPGTNILNLTAYTGAESSSVIVSFSVDGVDSENWTLSYRTDGEEEKHVTFSGHLVTLTGLTVGKTYHLSLVPETDTILSGEHTLTFTASEMVYAEALKAIYQDGTITATWNTPDGVSVEYWTVHCFSNNGYDQTEKASGNQITFTGIAPDDTYMVEVIAAGMTQSVRETVRTTGETMAFEITQLTTEKIEISCQNPTGKQYTLRWQIGDLDPQEQVVSDEDISISPVLPGAQYTITLLDEATGVAVCEPIGCTVPKAEDFCLYGLEPDDIIIYMLRSPQKENWGRSDVNGSMYTTTFASGVPVSYLFRLNKAQQQADDSLGLMFAIYQKDELISTESRTLNWNEMWTDSYCPLDIGDLPDAPGNYKMVIYFGGYYLNTIHFTIT